MFVNGEFRKIFNYFVIDNNCFPTPLYCNGDTVISDCGDAVCGDYILKIYFIPKMLYKTYYDLNGKTIMISFNKNVSKNLFYALEPIMFDMIDMIKSNKISISYSRKNKHLFDNVLKYIKIYTYIENYLMLDNVNFFKVK